MEISVNAAFDGKKHIPLRDDADLTQFKVVDAYRFVMKDSDIFSMAAADSVVSAMPESKEASGLRSYKAEERLFPLAYAKVHIEELYKNGIRIMPVTLVVVAELGAPLVTYLINTAEASSDDFLAVAPPSGVNGGGKRDTDLS